MTIEKNNMHIKYKAVKNAFATWLLEKNVHQIIISISFLSLLVIGSEIFDDYGISMDEPIQRKHGIVSLEYLNWQLGEPFNIPKIYNIDVETYDHRDYGVIFQMFSYGLELTFHLRDSQQIFLLRHGLVFLLFWVSTIYFCKLLDYHFKNWKIALLGTVFLVLSPRIFANSFYNPKDIPLLSWCIISTYTFLRLLDCRNFKYAILHGFVCALAIDTRIVAVYIPALTIGFLILDWFKTKNKKSQVKEYLRAISLFAASCIVFTVMFWPYLWTDPVTHFLYSLGSMSHFRWHNVVFFMGDLTYPENLPWYYILLWVFVSTPILYLMLFFIGIGFFTKGLIANGWKLYATPQERNLLVFLALFLIPPVAVILLKSTVYNGWRHLFFIYPPLIAIASYGLHEVLTPGIIMIRKAQLARILKPVVYVILFVSTGKVAYDMVDMHPFQNVYFNEVIGNNAGKYFDLDYSGVSFRQALESVLTKIDDDKVKVAYSSFCGTNNEYILPYTQRNRLIETDLDSADFFLTNYHLNLQTTDQVVHKKFPYNQRLIGGVKVKGNDIMGIYLLNSRKDEKGGVTFNK